MDVSFLFLLFLYHFVVLDLVMVGPVLFVLLCSCLSCCCCCCCRRRRLLLLLLLLLLLFLLLL